MKSAPYQLVLDFSSTTSLKAAVNAGPFLLRLTAMVMLSTASQLAIRDAPFLLGGVAMMLTFSCTGSLLSYSSYGGYIPASAAWMSTVTHRMRGASLHHKFRYESVQASSRITIKQISPLTSVRWNLRFPCEKVVACTARILHKMLLNQTHPIACRRAISTSKIQLTSPLNLVFRIEFLSIAVPLKFSFLLHR